MKNDTPRADELEGQIKRLEARFDKLASDLDRVVKIGSKFDETLGKRLDILSQGQQDVFERVKNLELKLFPNLSGDIMQVYNIIGEGDDKAYQPLDRRKP